MRRYTAMAMTAAMLLATACGGDDGTGVRTIEEGGSGSVSGSGSGSGPASGSASGSGTATESGSASGSGTANESGSASGSGSGPAAAVDPGEADEQVAVLLSEHIVEPEPASVPAGLIGFAADNAGELEHELYIARAGSADELPLADDGSVEEDDVPDADFIGEIEDIPAGEEAAAAFQMEPGTYVLFCNIVEDDIVHFAEGMHAEFTVE
jgi:hypothetical protein